MMYWSESLSTGVEVIDEDHRTLFGLINNIQAIRDMATEAWKIDIAIDSLNDYAEQHFKREEALMLLCGYSAQPQHEDEHHNFSRTVTSLRYIYRVCPQMVSIEGVIGFLEAWLQHHIAVGDKAYVEQMHAHRPLIEAASNNLLREMRLIA